MAALAALAARKVSIWGFREGGQGRVRAVWKRDWVRRAVRKGGIRGEAVAEWRRVRVEKAVGKSEVEREAWKRVRRGEEGSAEEGVVWRIRWAKVAMWLGEWAEAKRVWMWV